MFKFFQKKQNYNRWLTNEIKEAKNLGFNLEEYVNANTHPLHAKQIKLALYDELSPKQIQKIANMKYINEEEIINLRNKFLVEPDFEYIKEYYKPNIIKETNEEININSLYGTILGDIIGSIYEFTDHKEVTNLIKNSSFFTDDTVLTIATMLAIMENDKEPDFRKWYIKLYKEFPRAGYGSAFLRWAIGIDIDNNIGYGSYGDGSAMRVSFIGTYYKSIDDVIKYAYQSAIVSHNHIDAVKGAIITAVVIWMCKNKYSKNEIKEYVYKHYAYDENLLSNKTTGYTHFNLKNPENNIFKKQGNISCNFAVPYAIYCFLESTSYEDCMKKVLSNFCDADTICAISGGIAAVFYGVNKKDIVNEKLAKTLKIYIDNCINNTK